ncbi:PLP-dependent aminotransferase family protein [Cryptosporangium aurantiacum]|uniref:DNA-binding transcriptional regulator, MocR family, contains an aminotransferase domain n=1 Tax=Cryptosporangium aurantiacum TaxID=134849 RepID=A0A1M7RL21_9ACTN|nr:PLP-dependent aminotransferase family protein [Cryptosporangium aurantiacum]SHN46840.1 DNA-binding transcriptional regulator, MocR family, contains an aminotransferase domain [Cryptosporangium aurantiacum]
MSGTTLDDYTDRYARRMRGMTVSEVRALFAMASRAEIVSLAGGSPFVSALPLDEIAEMTAALIRDRGAEALQYGTGQGDVRLRELVCDVMAVEGVIGSAEDVVITVGSQQGLDLIAHLFLDPGDVVLAEGPSYVGALGTFAAAEAEVVHVPMDAEGLIPSELDVTLRRLTAEGRTVKFLYTVPNFQNPTGVTLTEPRRDAIVELAERYDLLIIEDNPYGLLGFEEGPGQALRARSSDRVIYLGSCSKMFGAGLRTGWVLAPPAVREKLVLVNESQVLSPAMLTQMIASEYLGKYPWREQLKVFREIYRERRDTMLDALSTMMPSGVTWTHPRGGFFVWATVGDDLDTKAMQPRALAHKVAYVPGIGFYADGAGRQNMRLCFSSASPDRIREGIRRLASVIEEETELRHVFNTPSAVRRGPHGGPVSRTSFTPGPELA